MEEQEITEPSQGMNGLRMLVGGEDVIEDKADHCFPEMLQEDLPLLVGRLQWRKQSQLPLFNPG